MIRDSGAYKVGESPELPDHLAQALISKGIAIQDKSMDGAKETKETPVISQVIKPRVKRHTK